MSKLHPLLLLAVAVCSAVALSGCRREKPAVPPPAPPPAEAPAAAPAPAAVAPSAPRFAAPAPATGTTRESNDAAYIQEMEQTLNDFLSQYIQAKKRIPKDIGEMISLQIITSVPVLPGGRQWVIDQRTGKISAR